ncbi:RNA polymerase sigma-70 factor (ECF subfamily) [Mucilaginibacter oryzae]|uniref:RNA polymerase sigma factor n=1 Tax=Mucilaginibacter oryzae TaxID=468058 RepID=A0A316HF01_9SPHI|nr:RNA polymerase sigma-70 factor [Mucilaginibacter oryzae]PWK78977.1 RNA polymerase sigma-70 factor (ECF subfamily) [Mucilaginibacter oryzae]
MFEITQSNEKELLMQVAEGNEFAFRRLFAIYHQRLGMHIFRITQSTELAEEVVQDVFLKIWMSRETLSRVDNFKAYLFVISKNHALNCLRKVVKEQLLLKKLEASNMVPFKTDSQDADQYYNLIDEAIDHLPPQQQKVYLMSRHNRLKYHEIADQMELSRETVKKYLQIATTSIKDYVHEHMDAIALILGIIQFFCFF